MKTRKPRGRHLFISYKREDAATAGKVRHALMALGFSVWWDEELQTGQKWDEKIDRALREAAAVVVLWSEAAVHSDWVKHEASVAKSRHTLAHARIQECKIPSTFSEIQAADLREWNGDEQEQQFQRLANSLFALRRKRQVRTFLLAVCALAIALLLAVVGAVTAFRAESIRNYLLAYFNVKPSPASSVAPGVSPSAGEKQARDKEPTITPPPEVPGKGERINLLARKNGGQLLAASSEAAWLKLISGDESGADVGSFLSTPTAVFAFKDKRPATFDEFRILIPEAGKSNVKDFELLQGNESLTGPFELIGKFQAQDLIILETPYQPFKFDPVTAKYLKVILRSNYGYAWYVLYQIQLFGVLQ
jgi:hypothetical protein